MFDTVECPYCEYDNDMTEGCVDLPSDNKFDHECENCEREFEVEVEFYPSYGASEIIYVECEKCGEETRDPSIRGRVFPYPKTFKADTICKTCYWKGVQKDYEEERDERD